MNEVAALPSPAVVLSADSIGTTAASDALPTHPPLPVSAVIGRRCSGRIRSPPGRGGPLQFPPPPSHRSTPLTPGGPSGLHIQDLRPFRGLRLEVPGSAPPRSRPPAGTLTTRQASLDAADRQVAPPPCGAFDAGLRPDPFPDRAASLLPGSLATTRTGLTPAGNDELMLDQVNSTDHLQLWTHNRESPPVAVGTALRTGRDVVHTASGSPPHRSQRAELPHWAPALGSSVKSLLRPGTQDTQRR